MRKNLEEEITDSCLNKAAKDEMIFVLLGRDAAAPYAIREWVSQRIAMGKNNPGDPQMLDALLCAATMESESKARIIPEAKS